MTVRYEIRPLGHWTDPTTPIRQPARTFRAPWTTTLDLLSAETDQLGAKLLVIQLDVVDGDVRRDGMLRANARAGHPGAVLSFNSDLGPLRYATDRFDHWQANVRAIALALTALRAVNRYGITSRHEQYVGFRALPAGTPNVFANADEALHWMRTQIPLGVLASDTTPDRLYRHLARHLHPDTGANPADWNRLDQAWQLITTAGDSVR